MARNERYRRTERPRGQEHAAASTSPDAEQRAEERARYGGFAFYMTGLLFLAALVALIATLVLWPWD
jgi:hypothetical protein